jgi:hypothetical protein
MNKRIEEGNLLPLDEATNNAKGIMQRPFCFLKNEHICASHKNTDRLALILDAGDFDDAFA